MDKTCWKKKDYLEVKVKKLEGDVLVVNQSTDNFTSQVGTSQALLTHTSQHEWVVDFGHAHHMAKDASLLSYLDKFFERNIYVVDDFVLDIVGHGDIPYRHGKIFNVYHVPNLSENLLLVSQTNRDK